MDMRAIELKHAKKERWQRPLLWSEIRMPRRRARLSIFTPIFLIPFL